MRLIDADTLKEHKYHSNEDGTPVEKISAWKQGWNDAIDAIANYASTVDAELVDLSEDSVNKIAEAVIRKITEPTEEQVEEYCRKRNLVMINREPFNEMKARFSEDAVKHGHWIVNDNHHTCRCSCCESMELVDWALDQAKYCPNCGAKMTGESDE